MVQSIMRKLFFLIFFFYIFCEPNMAWGLVCIVKSEGTNFFSFPTWYIVFLLWFLEIETTKFSLDHRNYGENLVPSRLLEIETQKLGLGHRKNEGTSFFISSLTLRSLIRAFRKFKPLLIQYLSMGGGESIRPTI